MSKARPHTIEVQIYDQRYSIVLKTALSESEVRELADQVDERMRNIAVQANTADSLKVAVLTALHLAQEYRELQQSYEEKTDRWARALDQVLKRA